MKQSVHQDQAKEEKTAAGHDRKSDSGASSLSFKAPFSGIELPPTQLKQADFALGLHHEDSELELHFKEPTQESSGETGGTSTSKAIQLAKPSSGFFSEKES